MKWIARALGVVLAIVVLAVVVLLVMGRRQGAGEIIETVEINRPPAVVWPWVTQPEKQVRWISGLVEIRPQNQLKGVGAKEIWVMHDPKQGDRKMEIMGEVTEVNEPRSVAVKVWSDGLFDGTARYDLEDLGNGRTRMKSSGKYRYSQAFVRLLEPMITPQASKKMNTDLSALKTLVEAEPANSQP